MPTGQRCPSFSKLTPQRYSSSCARVCQTRSGTTPPHQPSSCLLPCVAKFRTEVSEAMLYVRTVLERSIERSGATYVAILIAQIVKRRFVNISNMCILRVVAMPTNMYNMLHIILHYTLVFPDVTILTASYPKTISEEEPRECSTSTPSAWFGSSQVGLLRPD